MDQINNVSGKTLSYKELLTEAGKHLAERKKQIFKRVLFINWPFLLLFVYAFFAQSYYSMYGENRALVASYVIAFLWTLFAVLYALVMRNIFDIEKVVWIDSYFDKKYLDQKQSSRIARKL